MSTSIRIGRPKGQSLTPQAIVQSAIDCLETEGITALGVNRVAKQLGVQPPAIYKHLEGNPGLYRAVRLEGWRRFVAAYCDQQQSHTSAEAQLRKAAHQYRQFAHQHPELYTFITNQPFDLSDVEFQEIYQDIAAFYEQALTPFCSSSDAVIDAGRLFHAALHGFVSAERAQLFSLPRSCDVSFEHLVETLIQSLQVEPQ